MAAGTGEAQPSKNFCRRGRRQRRKTGWGFFHPTKNGTVLNCVVIAQFLAGVRSPGQDGNFNRRIDGLVEIFGKHVFRIIHEGDSGRRSVFQISQDSEAYQNCCRQQDQRGLLIDFAGIAFGIDVRDIAGRSPLKGLTFAIVLTF